MAFEWMDGWTDFPFEYRMKVKKHPGRSKAPKPNPTCLPTG
jgi:hypothetical protein